jgi:hypothetical protein
MLTTLYRCALYLYAAEHRRTFGTETIGVFECGLADPRNGDVLQADVFLPGGDVRCGHGRDSLPRQSGARRFAVTGGSVKRYRMSSASSPANAPEPS